ncbi:MAG: hypothetical protein RLZZ338_3949 [Cyanobacteriota bacterium]|jgi:hypothetical protein
MTRGRFFWQNIILLIQSEPPRLIELVMLSLAIILGICWLTNYHWPYLVLSVSYAVGSATSLWIRELILPSSQVRFLIATGVLLLSVGLLVYSTTVVIS